MRFSLLVAGAFAALVSAQSASTTPTSMTTATQVSVDPAQSSAQAAILACLRTCPDSDVNCKARCVNVPYPNADQANATNTCAAACNQGNGGEQDNIAFADCVAACIGKNYYTSGGTPPVTTGSSGSGSGSANPTATSASTGASGSGSGTGASASQTSAPPQNAAGVVRGATSAIGLIAFLAAMLTL